MCATQRKAGRGNATTARLSFEFICLFLRVKLPVCQKETPSNLTVLQVAVVLGAPFVLIGSTGMYHSTVLL